MLPGSRPLTLVTAAQAAQQSSAPSSAAWSAVTAAQAAQQSPGRRWGRITSVTAAQAAQQIQWVAHASLELVTAAQAAQQSKVRSALKKANGHCRTGSSAKTHFSGSGLEPWSLPHRQLSKHRWPVAFRLRGSLPHRQLSKASPGQDSSLTTVTAAQAAQQNKQRDALMRRRGHCRTGSSAKLADADLVLLRGHCRTGSSAKMNRPGFRGGRLV